MATQLTLDYNKVYEQTAAMRIISYSKWRSRFGCQNPI